MEVEEAAISPETEEEPLDLLACRNQLGRILKKLDYATYGRMEETCSRLKEVCTSSGIKAEHEVYQIRVDTVSQIPHTVEYEIILVQYLVGQPIGE